MFGGVTRASVVHAGAPVLLSFVQATGHILPQRNILTVSKTVLIRFDLISSPTITTII